VPLAEADTGNYYNIAVTPPANLSGLTVTARVRMRQGGDGGFQLVVQDDEFDGIYPWTSDLADIDDGEWHELSTEIATANEFDAEAVRQFGLVVSAGSAGSWETTILEVDWVRVTGNVLSPHNFDGGSHPLDNQQNIAGSELGWIE
jgi:hypothetical protein